MKLSCEVRVVNRTLPELAIKSKTKHLKSTLAVCRTPKSTKFCIILFSSQNTNGTKYEVNGNIKGVLTRFVAEGKTTIQFKNPPHDLHIQADQIQLKTFLHALRCAIENKQTDKKLFETIAAAPIAKKNIPLKKLIIESRSQYPLRGFPRTLEVLHIKGIERCGFDLGILKLTKLKVLDLSNNCIECIPPEFCNLPNVVQINLSSNNFGKRPLKDWGWLSGRLAKSLQHLNLSHNNLRVLPDNIIKLYNLIDLDVSNNQLRFLPSGIGNLKLKTFLAAGNMLSSLPGCVKRWRLELIDLHDNNFQVADRNLNLVPMIKIQPVWSLKEIAAKKVLTSRLPYSPETLVRTLIHYLSLAKYCMCGNPCIETYIPSRGTVHLQSIADSHITATNENIVVPIECYYCSVKCSTIRVPITR